MFLRERRFLDAPKTTSASYKFVSLQPGQKELRIEIKKSFKLRGKFHLFFLFHACRKLIKKVTQRTPTVFATFCDTQPVLHRCAVPWRVSQRSGERKSSVRSFTRNNFNDFIGARRKGWRNLILSLVHYDSACYICEYNQNTFLSYDNWEKF